MYRYSKAVARLHAHYQRIIKAKDETIDALDTRSAETILRLERKINTLECKIAAYEQQQRMHRLHDLFDSGIRH